MIFIQRKEHKELCNMPVGYQNIRGLYKSRLCNIYKKGNSMRKIEQTVERWETSDGKLFNNEKEAIAHEASLNKFRRIEHLQAKGIQKSIPNIIFNNIPKIDTDDGYAFYVAKNMDDFFLVINTLLPLSKAAHVELPKKFPTYIGYSTLYHKTVLFEKDVDDSLKDIKQIYMNFRGRIIGAIVNGKNEGEENI